MWEYVAPGTMKTHTKDSRWEVRVNLIPLVLLGIVVVVLPLIITFGLILSRRFNRARGRFPSFKFRDLELGMLRRRRRPQPQTAQAQTTAPPSSSSSSSTTCYRPADHNPPVYDYFYLPSRIHATPARTTRLASFATAPTTEKPSQRRDAIEIPARHGSPGSEMDLGLGSGSGPTSAAAAAAATALALPSPALVRNDKASTSGEEHELPDYGETDLGDPNCQGKTAPRFQGFV